MIEIKRYGQFANSVYIDGEPIKHQTIDGIVVKINHIEVDVIAITNEAFEYHKTLKHVEDFHIKEELTPIAKIVTLILMKENLKRRTILNTIKDYAVAYVLKSIYQTNKYYWKLKIKYSKEYKWLR